MQLLSRQLSPLACLAILASLPAQNLQLQATGGSMPGDVEVQVAPALYPFELMLIIPSTSAGPTPIALFDPADSRSLDVGLDLVGSAFPVIADLNLVASLQFSIGSQPSLVDLPLYFQAVTFAWGPILLDRLSSSDVVRLGNSDSFRDRNVFMQEQRAFATTLELPGRKTMVAGGARGQLLAQVATLTTEVYSPLTDTFTYGPPMVAPRSLHTMTLLQNGRYLFAGGVDDLNNPQSSCEVFDPVTNSFTLVASMNSARMGHTATLLSDGRVFVTGGFDALSVTPTQLSAIRDAVDTTEIYDPVTDTWAVATPMSVPRSAHLALHRPDGKVLLCGGVSWDPNIFLGWVPTVRSSCDLYDPVTNSMSSGPSMSASRALTNPVEITPGRWLVAGGMNGLSIIPLNAGNPTAAAEIYDAAANAWTTVGSLNTARANHSAWSIGNGRFILAGGGAGSVLSPSPLPDSEIFDTASNTFSPGPVMSSGRAGAAVFKAPHGQVHLLGGAATNTTITTTTEWYYF